jgi:dihydrolipoamide dehydrogenase
MQEWKQGIVSKLESGVEALLKGNGAKIFRGEAELESPQNIIIDGETEVSTRNVVIATGSMAMKLPGIDFDGKLVVSSTEALEFSAPPSRLLIVGGGVIGMEIACMLQKFGTEITVVELTDQLLPGTDAELVRLVQRNLESRGAKLYLSSRVAGVEKDPDTVKVAVETPEGKITVEADKLLLSIGRKARTNGLNLEKIGVDTDQKGYVKTDERMKTNVEGIYAIGDVKGPPLLAHKASKEGIVAAEVIAGLPAAADWRSMPDAIFTDPEIATVGLTEKGAVELGYEVKKNKFPFAALGRALAVSEPEGFAKVISDSKTGVVLGVQIVGPEASDLISEASLALELGATAEDIALTIHPHPTLPEAIMEAAEAASGRPIHQLRL